MGRSIPSDGFNAVLYVSAQRRGSTLNREFIIKSPVGFAIQYEVFTAASAKAALGCQAAWQRARFLTALELLVPAAGLGFCE